MFIQTEQKLQNQAVHSLRSALIRHYLDLYTTVKNILMIYDQVCNKKCSLLIFQKKCQFFLYNLNVV